MFLLSTCCRNRFWVAFSSLNIHHVDLVEMDMDRCHFQADWILLMAFVLKSSDSHSPKFIRYVLIVMWRRLRWRYHHRFLPWKLSYWNLEFSKCVQGRHILWIVWSKADSYEYLASTSKVFFMERVWCHFVEDEKSNWLRHHIYIFPLLNHNNEWDLNTVKDH